MLSEAKHHYDCSLIGADQSTDVNSEAWALLGEEDPAYRASNNTDFKPTAIICTRNPLFDGEGMSDLHDAMRELGMEPDDTELTAIAELEKLLADDAFTTERFLAGDFQDILQQANILLLENPHGGDTRWHCVFHRRGWVEEGCYSPASSLSEAILRYKEHDALSREIIERVNQSRRENDQYFLGEFDPPISVAQPWSFSVPESIGQLERVVTEWGTDRTFVQIYQKERSAEYMQYIVQAPVDNHSLGTIHIRALSKVATEVIYIPGAYHIHSSITMASLHRTLRMMSLPDSVFSDKDEIPRNNLDSIFDAWYAEKRKGKHIILKQWAAQSGISYHYLSRHHKAYRERQRLAKDDDNESQ